MDHHTWTVGPNHLGVVVNQVNIISNPVNSTVPIAAEVMKKHGVRTPLSIPTPHTPALSLPTPHRPALSLTHTHTRATTRTAASNRRPPGPRCESGGVTLLNSLALTTTRIFSPQVYDPARLFGVTTLDVTRARTFVGKMKGIPVSAHPWCLLVCSKYGLSSIMPALTTPDYARSSWCYAANTPPCRPSHHPGCMVSRALAGRRHRHPGGRRPRRHNHRPAALPGHPGRL